MPFFSGVNTFTLTATTASFIPSTNWTTSTIATGASLTAGEYRQMLSNL